MEYTDEQSYILTKDVSRNGRYKGITYSSTPSNPIRLAHMMRLAQMARVQGFLVECKIWPDLNSSRRIWSKAIVILN